jgi:hypothetical protein
MGSRSGNYDGAGLVAREVNLFQSDDKQTIWSRLGAFDLGADMTLSCRRV